MPLAFAPPLPPKPFRFAPATHPAPAPVTLLTYDQRRPSFRYCNPDSPHASVSLFPVSADRFLGFGIPCAEVRTRCSGVRKAVTSSVLVNSAWGLGWSSAGIPELGSAALKALSHSVLVKRIAQALVHCAPAFDLRLGVECCPENGSAKRALGLGSAVVGGFRLAWQSVLVKSFSSPCPAPVPMSGNPSAGSSLKCWGGVPCLS